MYMHLIALPSTPFFPLAHNDGPTAQALAAQWRKEGLKSICPIF